jgi:gliding motility-associated-like protein
MRGKVVSNPKLCAMKKGLPNFIFLLVILFAFSGVDALAQGREGGSGGGDEINPPILRGQRNDTIPDLESYYCSEGAPDDIYIDPSLIPPGATKIVWKVYINKPGPVEEVHPEWVDEIGTAPENGIRFFPTRVDASYYGTYILISYQFSDGMGPIGNTNYDYTVVRKTPDATFTLGDTHEICLGKPVILTLNGSESGIDYYLYRDGVLLDPTGPPTQGTGSPLTFSDTPTAVGVYQYSVQAQRDGADIACETWMNGSPVVTVNPVPVPVPETDSPTNTYCEGIDIKLYDDNGENPDYEYSWTGPGISEPAGRIGHTITVTGVTAGTHEYYLTITDNDPGKTTHCSATESISVTVNESPSASPSVSPSEVCVGESITISANASKGTAPYSYEWSTSDNPSFTTVDAPSITINPSTIDDNNDVYSVLVTDANGCKMQTAADAPALVVHENPSVTITTNPVTGEVCEDGEITFTATDLGTGYSYQWYLDGAIITGANGTSLTFGGSSPHALPAIGVDYEVSVKVDDDATSCSTTETIKFTVKDKPEVEITGPLGAEACSGDIVTLTAVLTDGPGVFPDDYAFEWYKDTGSGPVLISGATTNTYILSGVSSFDQATYSVIITHSNGCSSDAYDYALTVHTVIPTISVNPGTTVCEGTSVTFTAGGGSQYEFFVDNGSGFTSVQPLSTDDTYGPVVLNNNDQVKVLVEDAYGCQATSDTLTMTVHDRPVISDIDNSGPYCENDTIKLSSTVTGGDISTSGSYQYSWTGPDGFTSNVEDPSFEPATTAKAGTYTLVVTDDNGCSSDAKTTDVVVNALPVPKPDNTSPVCGDGTNSVMLKDTTSVTFSSYEWLNPANNPISNSKNHILTSVIPANAGIYTLNVVDANGCKNSATTNVVIYDIPEVSLGNDTAVCKESSITLIANITSSTSGPYTYTWYKDTGSGPVLISGVSSGTYTLTNVSSADAATYSVVVGDANGCSSATDDLVLTVNELPVVNPSADDICASPDNDIELKGAPSDPDYSYTWSGPGLSGAVAGQNINVTDDGTTGTPGTYQYTLTIENTVTGCTNDSTIDVEVFENPDITMVPVNPVCVGSPFAVTANVTGGSGSFSYSWEFKKKGTTVYTGLSYTTNTFTIDPAGVNDAGTYKVTVVDSNTSCASEDSVEVTVNELPIVSLADVATCDGQDTTLTAVASGGSGNYVEYIWYNASSTVIAQGSSNKHTLTGADVALANDGATYSVTVEDDNGCVSAPDDMTLTVNENPTVIINAGDAEINVCLGEAELSLKANTTGGSGSYSYSWEKDGSTIPGVFTDTYKLFNISAGNAGTYSVTVTDGVNCSATAQVKVIVNEVTPTWLASASSICPGTEVTFIAGNGDAYEFFHIDVSAGTTTSVQGPGTDYEWKTTTLEDGDQVFAIVSNSLGCSENTDTTIMKVYPTPTVSIQYPSGHSNEVCEGDNLEVIADPAGYANYDFYMIDQPAGTVVKVSPDGYSSNTFEYPASSFIDGDEFYIVAGSGAGCSGESAHETVVVHSLPTASASNDGPKCEGFVIKLQGGVSGLSYDWFSPGSDIDTDTPIASTMDHDLTGVALSDAGKYILRVTDTNGCENTDTTDVVVHEVPEVDLGSDITACEGTDVKLEANVTGGTAPYTYSWEKDGTALAGVTTDSYTMFGISPSQAGKYKVTVTDDNGCVSAVDSVQVTVNGAPTVTFDTSKTVNEVCDGEQVTLRADGADGVVSGNDSISYKYIWYYKGSVIPGVNAIQYSFAGNNGVNDGAYEVVAVDDNGNGCSSAPASITVNVYSLPNATLTANPAFFIEGTTVDFTAGGGDEYIFYVNGTEVQARSTSNTWSSNTLVNGDSVSVEVFEDHGTFYCESSAYKKMTVFSSVNKPTVDVTGEEYCSGSTGATVEVTNPQMDVTYELVYDDGTAVSGYAQIIYDGTNSVSWSNVLDDNGGTSTPATFRVKAFWAVLTPTGDQLSDAFDITEHPLPAEYTMTVEGTAVPLPGGRTETGCNGGAGFTIGLDNSASFSDRYVLILNGSQSLDTIPGNSAPISFGAWNLVGTYTIYAYNDHSCVKDMLGSFTINGTSVSIFNLTADNNGQYCEGTTGVDFYLSGSEAGVDYQLLRDGNLVITVTGDGNPIGPGNTVTFGGPFTQEGTYRVQVTTTGGCTYVMNNDVYVGMVSTPDAGTLTATDNGHYCTGQTGVDITLNITQVANVTYELYDVNSGSTVGTPVVGTSGGGDITFVSDFTTEGTYKVKATTSGISCEGTSNEITVVGDPLPDKSLNVGQDGEKCGTASTKIFIENTETDVEYQWENTTTGSTSSGWASGTGSDISFDVVEEGTYVFHARKTGTATQCEVTLNNSVQVIQRDLPDANRSVTFTGGTDCLNGVVLTIDNPETGVDYQLYKLDSSGNRVYVGNPISDSAGSGAAISFDPIVDKNADYYILAIDQTYGCESTLTGSPWTVNISGALRKQILKPQNGEICNGDAGLEFYLEDSEEGISYVLSLDGAGTSRNDTITSPVGGGMITFNSVLEEGEYYVVGLSSDPTCNSEMANRATLTVHPLPTAFNMIGPGTYCGGTGAILGVEGSETGVRYRLQQHTASGKLNVETINGNGDTIRFSPVTDQSYYSVVAISDKGCTSSIKDSIEVKSLAALNIPEIGKDTVNYCSLDYSTKIVLPALTSASAPNITVGATYGVFAPDSTLIVESKAASASSDLELGPVTEGKYVIRAYYEDGGCVTAASDTIWVFESLQPVVSGVLNSDYNACYGDSVYISYNISGDDPNWQYSIVDGSYTPVLLQNDAILDADSLTWYVKNTGDYYVEVSNGFCSAEYSSKIHIYVAEQIPLPTFASDTVKYCNGDNGGTVTINPGSGAAGLNLVYRLLDSGGALHGAVFNDDADPSFEGIGEDTYGLIARDISSGCQDTIKVGDANDVTVTEYDIPASYSVNPVSKVFNPDEGGVEIELSGSQTGVDYYLLLEGETEPVDTIHGIGSSIHFDEVVVGGKYEVYAKFSAFPCDWILIGTSVLKEREITIYDVDETGTKESYCETDVDSEGVPIILKDSEVGVEYQLRRSTDGSAATLVETKTGNGAALIFRDKVSTNDYDKTFEYSVWAIADDGAETQMNNAVITSVRKMPETQSITSDVKGLCNDEDFMTISVEDAEVDYQYRLEYHTYTDLDLQTENFVSKGSLIRYTGTGDLPSWPVSDVGYYRVVALNTGCEAEDPSNILTVRIYDDPIARDTLLRFSKSKDSGSVQIFESKDVDDQLDLTDYKYSFEYPVKDIDGNIFSYINGYVVFLYDQFTDGKFDGSPYIQYTKPTDFVGKDSIKYYVNIGLCPDAKADTGLITVIVGNKILPDDNDMLFPNAFSPNDDGMNDKFVITGIPSDANTSLSVFNRWGTLIYKSKGIRYENNWDGTSNVSNMVSIGDKLPNGVYFYVFSVKIGNDAKEYNGYIELRR